MIIEVYLFDLFGAEVDYLSLDNLLVAHTCFFHLDLPSYEDEEVLKQKLLTAINFGLGEFMLR